MKVTFKGTLCTRTPRIRERIIEVQREPAYEQDHCAVCLLKSGMIMGHVPRELFFETSCSFLDVVEKYLIKLLVVKDCVYTFTGWVKIDSDAACGKWTLQYTLT